MSNFILCIPPIKCHDGEETYVDSEGMYHGAPCANGSYYNPERQYEIVNPIASVYNVNVNGQYINKDTNYDQFKPNYEYRATWTSNNGQVYHHRRVAVVDKTSNHS